MTPKRAMYSFRLGDAVREQRLPPSRHVVAVLGARAVGGTISPLLEILVTLLCRPSAADMLGDRSVVLRAVQLLGPNTEIGFTSSLGSFTATVVAASPATSIGCDTQPVGEFFGIGGRS